MAEAKTVVIWVFQRQFVTAWLSVRCLAGREADTEVFPGRDFRGHFLRYRNQWKPCLLSAFLVLSNLHYVSRLLSFLHLNSSCNNSFPVSASLLGVLVTLLWVPWRTEILSLSRKVEFCHDAIWGGARSGLHVHTHQVCFSVVDVVHMNDVSATVTVAIWQTLHLLCV